MENSGDNIKGEALTVENWFMELGAEPPYQHPSFNLHKLSEREQEVLAYLAAGSKALATGTSLSVNAMHNAQKSIHQKLGISNRSQLTQYAIAAGVVDTAKGDALQEMIAAYVHLSPQKRKVFGLVGSGYSNKEIGVKLGISPYTAGEYKDAIYKAFDIHNVADATVALVSLKLAAEPLAHQKRVLDLSGVVRQWVTSCAAEPPKEPGEMRALSEVVRQWATSPKVKIPRSNGHSPTPGTPRPHSMVARLEEQTPDYVGRS